MLFPSQSISGKEVGIEQFSSPKIVIDAGEEGRWGGRHGGRQQAGREGRKGTWETKMECVCLCERGERQDGERQ